MAFVLRTLTARRYRVEGDLPPVHADAFRRRLADRAFRPLSPHEERSVGWVTADNFLDADFSTAVLVRGPCAAFALRVDRRRVSSRLLRARVDLEWRARRRAAADLSPADGTAEGPAKGGARRRGSGREERAEVRRAVTEELLASTSPSTDVHGVLVYPRARLVLFLSTSRSANDAFRDWFTQTFDVTLSALTPYHRALELLAGRGASEALADVRRTEFGAVPGGEGVVPASVRRGAVPRDVAGLRDGGGGEP